MYKISEQLLKAVLGYLATRPYQEVNELIYHLQRLEQVKEEKVVDKKVASDTIKEK